jgi:opacity protein-like surface antigen
MNRLLMYAAAAALAAGPAWAEGPYLSLQGGTSFLDDARDAGNGIDIESHHDSGWALSGAAGYGFANGLRLEGEIAYRKNDITELAVRSDGGLGASLGGPSLNGATLRTVGNETALSFMANGWYDLKTGTPFTPHLGGGIGLAQVKMHGLQVAGTGLTLVEDSDLVLAYQLGAGVSYEITPRLNFTLDYRFFATSAPTFVDFERVHFDAEYMSHSVMAGVRVGF